MKEEECRRNEGGERRRNTGGMKEEECRRNEGGERRRNEGG